MSHKLLLATNNQDKVVEYRILLSNLPFTLVTPAEVGITTKVQETGSSLEENAGLKATELAAFRSSEFFSGFILNKQIRSFFGL